MIVDNESDPGSWDRELRARGSHGPKMLPAYTCGKCNWHGTNPSITDASSMIERDGRWEMDRTHMLCCPVCFELLRKSSYAAEGSCT